MIAFNGYQISNENSGNRSQIQKKSVSDGCQEMVKGELLFYFKALVLDNSICIMH